MWTEPTGSTSWGRRRRNGRSGQDHDRYRLGVEVDHAVAVGETGARGGEQFPWAAVDRHLDPSAGQVAGHGDLPAPHDEPAGGLVVVTVHPVEPSVTEFGSGSPDPEELLVPGQQLGVAPGGRLGPVELGGKKCPG